MLALHIVLYVLLGTSLTFSIIELGLAGYGTSLYSGDREVASYSYYGGLTYSTVHVTPPAILIFVLFACCWSILVCTAALVLPWYYSRKDFVTPKLNATLGISTIVVYFVTSVFWLASFADIVADLGGGGSVYDIVNAVIAFAVLLWLLFLAIAILAVLAVCGVMVSDWAGYQSMKKGAAGPEQPQFSAVPAPAHDAHVPMSTAPAPVAASELSSRDAEAFHDQPPTTQTYSPPPPSNYASAELSGVSATLNGPYSAHHP